MRVQTYVIIGERGEKNIVEKYKEILIFLKWNQAVFLILAQVNEENIFDELFAALVNFL